MGSNWDYKREALSWFAWPIFFIVGTLSIGIFIELYKHPVLFWLIFVLIATGGVLWILFRPKKGNDNEKTG